MILPAGFEELFRESLGDDAFERYSSAIAANVTASVRINPLKFSCEELLRLWPEAQQVPWCSSGFYLPARPNFTLDPLFHAGAYYVQDASSMFLEAVLRQIESFGDEFVNGAASCLSSDAGLTGVSATGSASIGSASIDSTSIGSSSRTLAAVHVDSAAGFSSRTLGGLHADSVLNFAAGSGTGSGARSAEGRGLRVLDLCAAPGGKSTHLLSLLGPGSLLVSNEVISSRATILKENLAIWGSANVVVTSSDSEVFAAHLPEFFDIVLVDAPCSGEGMFRKMDSVSGNTAVENWSLENVKLCAARQQRILASAVKCLKPGGWLIYSTCTYNHYENDDQLAFLKSEFGFEVHPVALFDTLGTSGIPPAYQASAPATSDDASPVYNPAPAFISASAPVCDSTSAFVSGAISDSVALPDSSSGTGSRTSGSVSETILGTASVTSGSVPEKFPGNSTPEKLSGTPAFAKLSGNSVPALIKTTHGGYQFIPGLVRGEGQFCALLHLPENQPFPDSASCPAPFLNLSPLGDSSTISAPAIASHASFANSVSEPSIAEEKSSYRLSEFDGNDSGKNNASHNRWTMRNRQSTHESLNISFEKRTGNYENNSNHGKLRKHNKPHDIKLQKTSVQERLPEAVESLRGAMNQSGSNVLVRQQGELYKILPWNVAADIDCVASAVRVLGSGVALGCVKGKDFIPDAQLATSELMAESDCFEPCCLAETDEDLNSGSVTATVPKCKGNVMDFSTVEGSVSNGNKTLVKECNSGSCGKAMAFKAWEVDRETAIKFLAKQLNALDNAPLGVLLICYRGKGLGFVKNIGRRVNNLLPNSRRILNL